MSSGFTLDAARVPIMIVVFLAAAIMASLAIFLYVRSRRHRRPPSESC